MTLASSLAPFVESRIRGRGREYFARGMVSLLSCGPVAVEAMVLGSEEYDVTLVREGQDLEAFCSCPYVDRGEPCKHIWATILAAEEANGLIGPRGEGPVRLVVGWDAPPSAPPPPPAWRRTLDALTVRPVLTPSPRGLAGREVLYLLDVAATLRGHKLSLQIMTGRRLPDGAWDKLSPLKLRSEEIAGLPDPGDRQGLALVSALGSETLRWATSYYSSQVPSRCEIPPAAASVLLPVLCATGRFRVHAEPAPAGGTPLEWDGGALWEIWLEVREALVEEKENEESPDCLMSASLRRNDGLGGEERQTAEALPVLLGASGFLLAGGRISALAAEGLGWAALLKPEAALRVPAADRDDLLERLLAAPDLPRLDLPESMRIEEIAAVPRPRLRLLPPRWERGWPRAELSFLYEDRAVAADSPQRGLYQPDSRRFLLRDPGAERKSAERLGELGFRPEAPSPSSTPPSLQIAAGRVPKVVPVLLAEGWAVEAEGKLYRTGGSFKMNVASGVDWFELHGEADFEGQMVPLPQLLAAIRKGAPFIPLSDGSLGMLPEEWIRKFAPMAALGSPEGDHLRFGAVQAVLLDAWFADEPTITCDAAFERARGRLREFSGIAPAAAPPGFKGELRGYQQAGLGWLHFLRDFGFGGCLADDMGLGKTVQVLALLESRRTRRKRDRLPPSLVVVPRSLIFNWLSEAARFTPRLRVLDHTGIERDGEAFAGHDLVLTTYGTLRKDIAALRETEFDYLILDEAQAIKNADSQTAKAARLLRGRHRLALSGTPVENHLGELWSLLEFLNPGILGASPTFRQHADAPRAPLAGNQGALARALRPLLLRRTKEAVAPELPPRLEQTIYCELPAKQRRLYDELRDHYRASLSRRIGEQGIGRAKIMVLEALLRLRQAACHPGLLDERRAGEPCAKLDLLLPQLREVLAEGHKALVFSQFTSFLALLRRQLDAEGTSYLYLDGRTRDRREKVEAFQTDPESRLFLISLKAGGLGLNLTGADYVYLLDPWWNPAVEAQAIDRAHRIGQARPVFASRLVARDTVEEKILDLQKTKRDLADAVIQADKSLLAALSREDLEMLLS
jgi:superfamily II DNA or RNA helicase